MYVCVCKRQREFYSTTFVSCMHMSFTTTQLVGLLDYSFYKWSFVGITPTMGSLFSVALLWVRGGAGPYIMGNSTRTNMPSKRGRTSTKLLPSSSFRDIRSKISTNKVCVWRVFIIPHILSLCPCAYPPLLLLHMHTHRASAQRTLHTGHIVSVLRPSPATPTPATFIAFWP
jgi:hypothetical protein